MIDAGDGQNRTSSASAGRLISLPPVLLHHLDSSPRQAWTFLRQHKRVRLLYTLTLYYISRSRTVFGRHRPQITRIHPTSRSRRSLPSRANTLTGMLPLLPYVYLFSIIVIQSIDGESPHTSYPCTTILSTAPPPLLPAPLREPRTIPLAHSRHGLATHRDRVVRLLARSEAWRVLCRVRRR
jgi:hypothetical protein